MKQVAWGDGRVVLVDRTGRARRSEVVETDEVERVALAMSRGEVRGAAATAAAAAYGLVLAAFRSPALCAEGLMADLETAERLLAGTRPGAAGLASTLDSMMEFARRRIAAGTEGFPEAMLAEARRVTDRDVEP